MDFEFFRDLNGTCRARFSMGHEAFGQWLTDEVTPAEAEALLGMIHELEGGRREEFRKVYAEFSLFLGRDEAELAAHTLAFANDELEEGMAYYDDELFAGCGLDDLARVLEQWRAFIKA